MKNDSGYVSTLSSTEKLMSDSKEFSASNWLIYPGLPKVRRTLRTLHEIAKEHKRSPITKMTQKQILAGSSVCVAL